MIGLDDSQKEIYYLAQEFSDKEFAPHAADWDREKHFPEDKLRKAAELGFAGLFVKSDIGGIELSRHDGSIVFEALAAGCTSTTAYLTIHNMCAWMIDTFGDDAQREQFLPKLLTMEVRSKHSAFELLSELQHSTLLRIA